MNMIIDYEFELEGKNYQKFGVNIGETDDLEAEMHDTKGLKQSAICNEFGLSFGYGDEKIEELTNKANFSLCELRD